MSQKTITDLIHLITWDRRIVKIPSEISSPFRYCMLLIPSIYDHNMANHIRDTVYEEAQAGGAPTESELLKLAIAADMWSQDNEDLIASTEDRINSLQSRLLKERALPRRKKTEKEIGSIRQQSMRLQGERAAICMASAEYMSHERMVFFLVSRLVCDLNGVSLWDDDDQFEEWRKEYPEAAIHLAHELTQGNIVSIKEIRRVARSPEWRLLWTTHTDNVQALFTQDIRSLNMSQKLLIYWSRVYDSAFESTERPDEETLENDDMFDAWFQNRLEEREERKLNKGHLAQYGKRTAVRDHHEQGVVIDGYYNEDCTCGALEQKGRGLGESRRHADWCKHGVFVNYTSDEKEQIASQIYGRNSKKVRQHVNKEQEYVADRGQIEEQNLRNKKSRMLLGSDQKIHARKR